jgi:hypothetical protein
MIDSSMDELIGLMENLDIHTVSNQELQNLTEQVKYTELDPFYDVMAEVTDSLAKISINDKELVAESKNGQCVIIFSWYPRCGMEANSFTSSHFLDAF